MNDNPILNALFAAADSDEEKQQQTNENSQQTNEDQDNNSGDRTEENPQPTQDHRKLSEVAQESSAQEQEEETGFDENEDESVNQEEEKETKKVSYKKSQKQKESVPEFDVPRQDDQSEEPEIPSGLNEDDQERAEMAVFAEKNLGEGYNGFGEKVINFLAAHKKFVDDTLAEDPDAVFDETNEEYQKFLRANDPKIPPKTWKKIEKAQWKHEARQEFENEKKQLEQKVESQNIRPQVDQQLETFEQELIDVLPDDQKGYIKEHGLNAFIEENPFEGEMIMDVLGKNYSMASDLIKINSGLENFDPQNSNHKSVAEYIEQQGQKFFERGGDYRMKDGKQFLPASAYQQAVAAGKGNEYWTFASKDILGMLKEESRREVSERTDKELKRLEKAGFVRQSAPTGGKKQPNGSGREEDVKPPKATKPTPRGSNDNNSGSRRDENPILKSLGY